MPKVSIIIPIYNSENYLKETMYNITNQTFKDIEIICVNDGSTDNSLSILNSLADEDNRIKVITQDNQYAGVARNNGIKVATGDYVIILDSDDIFELNMIEKMYKKLIEDDSDIVICGWNSYNDELKRIIRKNEIEDRFIKISPFAPIDIKDELFTFSKPNTWTKMFKRELFVKNNLQFESCKCYNDMTCVHLLCVLANKISVMKECFVSYKYNRQNNLTSQWKNNFSCLLYAIVKLEEKLRALDLYQTYKQTFIIRCGKAFDLSFKKLNEENKEQAKKYSINVLSKELCDYILIKYKIPLLKRREISKRKDNFF